MRNSDNIREELRMRFYYFNAFSWVCVVVAAFLIGCADDKASWDAKIKEMCLKDGGVTIYERVPISKTDIDRRILPMTGDGRLGVTTKKLAHPDAPVYSEEAITSLNEWNPRVSRVESIVRRRKDGAVVAKLVVYGRWGGDLPSPAHESSFGCPDLQKITTDLHGLFVVTEASK